MYGHDLNFNLPSHSLLSKSEHGVKKVAIFLNI